VSEPKTDPYKGLKDRKYSVRDVVLQIIRSGGVADKDSDEIPEELDALLSDFQEICIMNAETSIENAALRAEVEQWKRNEQIARNAIIEIGEKYIKLEAALDYWFEYGGWGTERRDINDEIPTHSDYGSCGEWLAALIAAHAEAHPDG